MIFATVAVPCLAQEPPRFDTAAAVALRDSAARSPAGMDLVRAITGFGGRIPGTEADTRSRAWAVQQLVAAGVDTVWEQPVDVRTWVRGVTLARLEESGPTLSVAAFGFSPATADTGVLAPVVRRTSARGILRTEPESLRGRVVFLDRPMLRLQDGRGYFAVVQQRPEAIAHAARAGALAVLVRSTGTSQTRTPHVSNLASTTGPRIPVAAVANPDADLLAAAASRPGGARLRLIVGGHDGPPSQSANIIAEIRGSELPEEVVLLAAHLDSWDLGSGAEDDAVGVAMVLEAARWIARSGIRPRRTIRFVLFAAEEQFLGGARVYADRLDASRRHVLAIEPDQGSGRPYRLRGQLAPESASLLDQLGDLLLSLGIDQSSEVSGAGPDLIPLRERGVPTLDIAQDMTELFDYAHSANDTVDKVRSAELRTNTAAYALVAFVAANWPGPITRRTMP
jgi:hypothetical protein